MSAPATVIGTQDATALRYLAQNRARSPRKLQTVADLVSALTDDKQIGMLRSTATHISECLNRSLDELAIQALVGLAPQFTTYLESRRYKKNAIRSYRNYLALLVRKASELGWTSEHPELLQAWEVIATAIAKLRGGRQIINYAINLEKSPATFTDAELNDWAQTMICKGRGHRYVSRLQYTFRRLIADARLAKTIPGIFGHWNPPIKYAVPLREFPDELRQEVLKLVNWKQAPYVRGRKPRARLRAVSALHLQNTITRLYGFVARVCPQLGESTIDVDISCIKTLRDLVTPESVHAYVEWWLNVRQLKPRSLAVRLGPLCAALKEYPAYHGVDFSWLNQLIREIPAEPESQRRERKERKYLPYDVVSNIPRLIRATRHSASLLGANS